MDYSTPRRPEEPISVEDHLLKKETETWLDPPTLRADNPNFRSLKTFFDELRAALAVVEDRNTLADAGAGAGGTGCSAPMEF